MDTQTVDTVLAKYDRYLRLYVADIDWIDHLNSLNKRKGSDAEHLNKQIACTILLPYYDKSVLTNPPENLLFWCAKYDQFNSRPWFDELKERSAKHAQYDAWQNELLDIGIIDPFEYYPNTRQAFKWLVEHAENRDECTDKTKEQFKNLVYIYGGAAICSVFQKPEWAPRIRNLHNWRTGFFFRELIYQIYSQEDLMKIKTMEINKLKNSGSTLVRQIKKG